MAHTVQKRKAAPGIAIKSPTKGRSKMKTLDESRLKRVSSAASNKQESFIHEPLDLDPSRQCIRLLKVTSACRDDARYELLNNVSLMDRPQFVALSYEWGSPTSKLFSININNRLMYIRRNLHAFLQRFIELHTTQADGKELPLLWIDAMCINQVNNNERNHQVAQMKRIYAQAAEVLIWLGEPVPFSTEAVSATVIQATKIYDMMMRDSVERDRPGSDFLGECARHGSRSFRPLLTLATMTYWTRIWVVQEILSSRKARILCGEHFLAFEKWAWALRYGVVHERSMLVKEALSGSSALRIADQWVDHRAQTGSWGILSLIIKFATSLSSEPHDKVYALLGISPDSGNFTINYDAPVMLAVIQAIGTTCWNISSSQFNALCQSMALGQVQAHAGLDLDFDVSTAMLTNDSGAIETALAEVELRLRAAYLQQVVQAERYKEMELIEWSAKGRVKLCSCNDCLKAEELQAYWSGDRYILDKSPDIVLMQPYRSRARLARPLLVYFGSQSMGQRYPFRQYIATAVFTASDVEDEPALLLYFDPDMAKLHQPRGITLARGSDGVPSHQVVVQRPNNLELSLAQSCRWYAHVLSNHQGRRPSPAYTGAIGSQTRDYRALDDGSLHGYLPPDFEPFEVSPEIRSSILHPTRSEADTKRYEQVMELLEPRLVSRVPARGSDHQGLRTGPEDS